MYEQELFVLWSAVDSLKKRTLGPRVFKDLSADERSELHKKVVVSGSLFEPFWRACFSKDALEVSQNFEKCEADVDLMKQVNEVLKDF
jgi:hypothetical protein